MVDKKDIADLGDQSQVIGDLMKIQQLMYETSEFKTGPKAGKITGEQFNRIISQSGVFKGNEEMNIDDKSLEYFTMLDTDNDNLIGFIEFIAPVMTLLPSEVATALTNDMRFKNETLNDLRLVYEEICEEKPCQRNGMLVRGVRSCSCKVDGLS